MQWELANFVGFQQTYQRTEESNGLTIQFRMQSNLFLSIIRYRVLTAIPLASSLNIYTESASGIGKSMRLVNHTLKRF